MFHPSSGASLFWLLAIVVTAVACAALYYAAAGRRVNATTGAVDDATSAHFRLQLGEIESDIASGRLNEAEGKAARAEMARELVRLKGEARRDGGAVRLPVLLLAIGATAVLAFGAYAYLGRPDLPSAPLSERSIEDMTLEEAIARIELQLTRTPDDLRGWVAIAPAYMQLGRFADAERAFRRIIALDGVSADRETDLAEAVMMRQGGSAAGEPLDLFRSAAARDPDHLRSRFYLAGEATRAGEFQSAIAQWSALIDRATGDEPWLATARAGLAAAEEGLNTGAGMPGAAEIGPWSRAGRAARERGRLDRRVDAARALAPCPGSNGARPRGLRRGARGYPDAAQHRARRARCRQRIGGQLTRKQKRLAVIAGSPSSSPSRRG